MEIPYFRNPKQEDVDSVEDYIRYRPILFQISDPISYQPLYPVLLALHINPSSFNQKMTKNKSVVPTVGGYIEFNWPDELSTISADGSTGAFINPEVGLASADSTNEYTGRHGSIAWERFQDLLELFRMNGCVFNNVGQPIFRGKVICFFDVGVFVGYFTNFSVNESDEKQFSFNLNWEFRIEKTFYKFNSLAAI